MLEDLSLLSFDKLFVLQNKSLGVVSLPQYSDLCFDGFGQIDLFLLLLFNHGSDLGDFNIDLILLDNLGQYRFMQSFLFGLHLLEDDSLLGENLVDDFHYLLLSHDLEFLQLDRVLYTVLSELERYLADLVRFGFLRSCLRLAKHVCSFLLTEIEPRAEVS